MDGELGVYRTIVAPEDTRPNQPNTESNKVAHNVASATLGVKLRYEAVNQLQRCEEQAGYLVQRCKKPAPQVWVLLKSLNRPERRILLEYVDVAGLFQPRLRL